MGAELRLAPPNPNERAATPSPTPQYEKRFFSVVKRGLDPAEVEEALRAADREIKGLREQIASLTAELAESVSRAHDRVRESTAAGFLGDEAARMLRATRTAAAELEQRAGERAQQLVDDAKLRSAAIMLQVEHETGKRLGDVDALEAKAHEAALAATEQARSNADLYAETIRAAADAHAAYVRTSADAEAKTLLGTVDEQIEEITRSARREAEEIIRGAELAAEERLAGTERRQRDMADRLTRERIELAHERDSVARRRTELMDLLDHVRSVAATGLIELAAQDPSISAELAAQPVPPSDASDVLQRVTSADEPTAVKSSDRDDLDNSDDLRWRRGA